MILFITLFHVFTFILNNYSSCAFQTHDVNSLNLARLPQTEEAKGKAFLNSRKILTKLYSKDGSREKSKKALKGTYVRPSAAIERGSGFYFPGLEGNRLQIFFGVLVLIANLINSSRGFSSLSDNKSFSVPEFIGVMFSLLLIFQGLFESFSDGDIIGNETNLEIDNDATKEVIQSCKPSLSLEIANELRWVGLNFLTLTRFTSQILFWDETDQICFVLSTGAKSSRADFQDLTMDSRVQAAIKSARESLSSSVSGTISVPVEKHPLKDIVTEETQCIILQRITEESSWGIITTSNEPLEEAYTKKDIMFLPILASYIESLL